MKSSNTVLIMLLAAVLAVLLAAGCGKKAGPQEPSGPFTMTLEGMKDSALPEVHTCYAAAPMSPALAWRNPPANTKSFALKAYDLDAGRTLLWYVFNVSPAARLLPLGLPDTDTFEDGTIQYKRWTPPCPKSGPPVHHIQFILYALDSVIDANVTDISGEITARATDAVEITATVARR